MATSTLSVAAGRVSRLSRWGGAPHARPYCRLSPPALGKGPGPVRCQPKASSGSESPAKHCRAPLAAGRLARMPWTGRLAFATAQGVVDEAERLLLLRASAAEGAQEALGGVDGSLSHSPAHSAAALSPPPLFDAKFLALFRNRCLAHRYQFTHAQLAVVLRAMDQLQILAADTCATLAEAHAARLRASPTPLPPYLTLLFLRLYAANISSAYEAFSAVSAAVSANLHLFKLRQLQQALRKMAQINYQEAKLARLLSVMMAEQWKISKPPTAHRIVETLALLAAHDTVDADRGFLRHAATILRQNPGAHAEFEKAVPDIVQRERIFRVIT